MENKIKFDYPLRQIVWIPVFFIVYQILSVLIDVPLVPMPKPSALLFAVCSYLILAITLIACGQYVKEKSILIKKNSTRFETAILWISLFFILNYQLLPAIRFGFLLDTLSLAQLREFSIYGGEILKEDIYLGKLGMMLGRYFAPELSWLLLSILLFANVFYKKIIISLLIISIVISNALVGGRTGLYFFLVLMLMYEIMRSKKITYRLMKIAMCFVLFAVAFSFSIQSLRADEVVDNIFLEYGSKIATYHYLPIYIYASLVDSSSFEALSEGVFLAYTFGSIFTPYAFLFGGGWQEVPIFRLWDYLNDPLLYSSIDGGVYNAFGTLFSALYLDFKVFTLLILPFYIYLFVFLIKFSGFRDKRPLYLWFCLTIYQSLFQPMMSGFFVLFVLFSLLMIGLIVRVLVKLKVHHPYYTKNA